MRLVVLAAMAVCCAAQAPPVFSVPGADAPELAHRGSHAVGVRTLDLVNPGQVDILHFNADTGKAPLYDRPLKIEVWYPAVIPAGREERTVYESAMPGSPDRLPPGVPKSFQIAGKALRDAPPAQGERFPLVVVSHGYPGSRTFLTLPHGKSGIQGIRRRRHRSHRFGVRRSARVFQHAAQPVARSAFHHRRDGAGTVSAGHSGCFAGGDCRLFHGRLWCARQRRRSL